MNNEEFIKTLKRISWIPQEVDKMVQLYDFILAQEVKKSIIIDIKSEIVIWARKFEDTNMSSEVESQFYFWVINHESKR